MAAWQSRQVEAPSLGYAGLTGVKNADARVAGLVTTDKRKAQGRLRLSGSQGGIILEDGSQGPWTKPANGWLHLLFALKGAPDFSHSYQHQAASKSFSQIHHPACRQASGS